jgi:hypothetical protein
MKKSRKPTRENVTPMQERDLSLAKGMADGICDFIPQSQLTVAKNLQRKVVKRCWR